MSEWQPIETERRDGDFKFYGLTVVHADRHKWFEAHYLYQDDVTGEMMEPSGDVFSEWSHDDFEVWAPAPKPLTPAQRTEQ